MTFYTDRLTKPGLVSDYNCLVSSGVALVADSISIYTLRYTSIESETIPVKDSALSFFTLLTGSFSFSFLFLFYTM